MKTISFQFCPSCGEYWSPKNQEEAKAAGKQYCSICHERIQYSWLGHILLSIVLGLLFFTSLTPSLLIIAPYVSILFLITGCFQGVKQYLARDG